MKKNPFQLLKFKTFYGLFVVIILWQCLHFLINSNVIPGPYETLLRFSQLIKGVLLLHMVASLVRIVIAVFVSLLVGVPLGLWIGINLKADEVISPIIYFLYPLPKIAFLPIFMILFGIGDLSKVVLIITIILFQIVIATKDGIKEIPKELIYSVSSMGISSKGHYRHLYLPSILPKLLSGLRISIGISISALFFAENVATHYGVGYFIMNAWTMVDYLDMFAGILALSTLGLFLLGFIDILEKKLCPWLFVEQ